MNAKKLSIVMRNLNHLMENPSDRDLSRRLSVISAFPTSKLFAPGELMRGGKNQSYSITSTTRECALQEWSRRSIVLSVTALARPGRGVGFLTSSLCGKLTCTAAPAVDRPRRPDVKATSNAFLAH